MTWPIYIPGNLVDKRAIRLVNNFLAQIGRKLVPIFDAPSNGVFLWAMEN